MDDNDYVCLGLMAPLSGLVELYGPEIARAGRIACDEINEQGGVLGRPLKLIVVDDGSLPDSAVPAAERLIDEHHCAAIIGNLLSNSRIAVANRVAEPRQVPMLNFSFYEGSILGRYFFHFAALPNQQIDRMIPYMTERFGPKMFFAGNNYEWPRGSIDAAKRVLTAGHGEIVGEEYLPIGCTMEEIDRLLEKVAHSGADVFVPYFAGADQIHLLTRFTERGLKPRMAVVMGHYDEAMVGNLPPEVREGFFSSNTYFMSVETPENRSYIKRLAAQPEVSGIWPRGNGVLTNFGEGTYICVHAFASAARAAGTLAPDALVAALEHVSVRGPQGEVVMDPVTHHARVNTYLSRCEADGTFSLVEHFGQNDPRIPERYRTEGTPAAAADSAKPLVGLTESAALPVGVAVFDSNHRLIHANTNLRRIWGYDHHETLIGSYGGDLWSPPEAFERVIKELSGEWTGRISARLSDGTTKPLEITLEPTTHCRNPATGYTLTCVDPLAPTDSLNRLETAHRILSVADIAIIATNHEGIIIQANEGACTLFGYPAEEIVGLSVHLLLPPHFRERHKQHLRWFVDADVNELPMGHRGEISGYRKDGTFFPAEATLSKFPGPEGPIVVATLRDISARKEAEEELLWKASHDPLTQLPNRALIRDRLTNALERSKRYGHGIALLFIDLDGFKLVNDSYGHDTGDRLLIAIGSLLMEQVRPGDTVARFGGDEFVILCEQADDSAAISGLAERINDVLRAPIEVDGQRLFATASIGVAYGHGATHSSEDLLRNADAAMYQAKDQGRDGWRVFNQEIHLRAKERLAIATGLRDAVADDELSLVFQPIVDCHNKRIGGVEALLRWTHAGHPVSPAVFIPVAEMTGSILSIGLWVFERACLMEARWRERFGHEHSPYVSINLSTRQLDDEGLVESFQRIIEETGADPSNLLLEVTETSLMADVEANLRVLNRLAELGLSMAVDDFGTGYSSLAQLLRLPVQTLKIDRIFVDGLDKHEESRTIVSTVVTMARALNLEVIAEGVENEEQLRQLKIMGCDRLQGFHLHRPMAAETLETLLATPSPP